MEGHGSGNGAEHWMALEGGADGSSGDGPYTSRFAGIGASVPEQRLTSAELMASTAHRTHIDLERLTGIHEHRVVAEGEVSYTLALAAAQDALAHTSSSDWGLGHSSPSTKHALEKHSDHGPALYKSGLSASARHFGGSCFHKCVFQP